MYSSIVNRRNVYLALSIVVSASILGYLFTYVSIADVVDVIVGMNRRALTLFFALSLSMSLFRTWRFAVILGLSGYRPGRVALFLVVIVRNFFSDLLPARIGTLVYVYLATHRLGVPFGAAASSFALSFLFDILALAPLLVVAAYFAGAVGALSPAALVAGSVSLFVVGIGVLALLPAMSRVAARLVDASRLVPQRHRASWSAAFQSTAQELERVKRGGIYGRVFVLSLMVRLCKYASLYVLLYALVEPLGYTLGQLPLPRVLLGLIAPELAASLPISGIGGFGAYEGAWAFVFSLLVFPGDVASLTAISHHLFTQAYGAVLGALALVLLLMPELTAVRHRADNRPTNPPSTQTGRRADD